MILNVVFISTVPVAAPIDHHVARFATVNASKSVDPALWSVAFGEAVPSPNLFVFPS